LTLLVVDDHEVVRQGLVVAARPAPRFQVVAEAGTVAESLDRRAAFQPDLVVHGRRAARRLGHRGLPRDPGRAAGDARRDADELSRRGGRDRRDRRRAPAATCSSRSGPDLVAALEAVGAGESLLDPAVTGKVLERMRRIADRTSTTSSRADAAGAKILALVAEGKTNKEIAAEVFLSDKTVKNYVSSILAKLNLERRAQAAAYVREAEERTRRRNWP
jgi:DNA-binding NarL/FixJ family response regulator